MEQTANMPGCRSSAANTAGSLSAAEGARPFDRLIEDAIEGAASRHPIRADGWTPDRIRIFLDVLSQCGVVEDAARACGMSKQGAYAFRNSARGRAFDVAWRSAQLLARNRIADDVMSRAIHGCREVIFRNGEVWGERHRFDNRLTMAVLARLDQLAGPCVGQIDDAPRKVAHEFEALVDAVCAGGEEGIEFIESRCALRYEDFYEARILERNHDYACSRDEEDDDEDGWEAETSSTSDEEAHLDESTSLYGDGSIGMASPLSSSCEAHHLAPASPPPASAFEVEVDSAYGQAPGSLESPPAEGGWRPEISSTLAAEEPAVQVARLIADIAAARSPVTRGDSESGEVAQAADDEAGEGPPVGDGRRPATSPSWGSAVVLGKTPFEDGAEGAVEAVQLGAPARARRGRYARSEAGTSGEPERVGA